MSSPIRLVVEASASGELSVRRLADSLSSLERSAVRANFSNSSAALNRFQSEVAHTAQVLESRFSRAVNASFNLLSDMNSVLFSIGRKGFYVAAAGAAVATTAFVKLGQSFIKVNEQFKGFEITLKSAFRSGVMARQLRDEVAKITAFSPLPFSGIVDAVKAFSVIPYTRSQLASQGANGNFQDPQGFLRRLVRLTEQLVAFRPDKTVDDAVFAIRELLTGEQRSLIRRFDIPPSLLEAAVGKPITAIKDNPELAFQALEKAFSGIINDQAIAEFAKQPSILLQNLIEQVFQRPALAIGDAGLFSKVTDYMQELFMQANEFMDNELKPLAASLSRSLSSLFDSSASGLGKVFDVLLEQIGFGSRQQPYMTLIQRTAGALEKTISRVSQTLPEFIDKVVAFFRKAVPALITFVDVVSGLMGRVATGLTESPILTTLSAIFLLKLPAIMQASFLKLSKMMAESITLGMSNAITGGSARLRSAQPSWGFSSFAPGLGEFARSFTLNAQGQYFLNPATSLARQNELAARMGLSRQDRRLLQAAPYLEQSGTNYKVASSAPPSAFRAFGVSPGSSSWLRPDLVASALAVSQRAGDESVKSASFQGAIRAFGSSALRFVGAVTAFSVAGAAIGVAVSKISDYFEKLNKQNEDARNRILQSTDADREAFQTRVRRLQEDLAATRSFSPFTASALGVDSRYTTFYPPSPGFGGFSQPVTQMERSAAMKPVMYRTAQEVGDRLSLLLSEYGSAAEVLAKTSPEFTSKLTGQKFSAEKSSDISELASFVTKLQRELLSLSEFSRGVGRVGESSTSLSPSEKSKLAASVVDFQNLMNNSEVMENRISSLLKFTTLAGDTRQASQLTSAEQVNAFTDATQEFFEPSFQILDDIGRASKNIIHNTQLLAHMQSLLDSASRDSGQQFATLESDAKKLETIFRSDLFSRSSVKVGEKMMTGLEIAKILGDRASLFSSGGRGFLEQVQSGASAQIGVANQANRNAISEGIGAILIDSFEKLSGSFQQTDMTTTFSSLGKRLEEMLADGIISQSEEAITHIGDLLSGLNKSLLPDLSVLTQDVEREAARSNQAILGWAEQLLAFFKSFSSGSPTSNVERFIAQLKAKQKIADQQRRNASIDAGAQAGFSALTSVLSGAGGPFGISDRNQLNAALAYQPEMAAKGLGDFSKLDLKKYAVDLRRSDDFLASLSLKSQAVRDLTSAAQEIQSKAAERFAARPDDGIPEYAAAIDQANTLLQLAERINLEIEETTGRGGILGSFKEGFQGVTQQFRASADNFKEVGRDIASSLQSSLGNSFSSFILGAENAGEAMRGFAVNVLQSAVQILSNKLAANLIGSIFNFGASSSIVGGWSPAAYDSAIPRVTVGAATGGLISGGSGYRDDVPAMLMGGEYVIRKSSVNKYGAAVFDAINSGYMPTFSSSSASTKSGGGDIFVTTNVNTSNGTSNTQVSGGSNDERQRAVELTRQIESVVASWHERQQRAGGSLSARR